MARTRNNYGGPGRATPFLLNEDSIKRTAWPIDVPAASHNVCFPTSYSIHERSLTMPKLIACASMSLRLALPMILAAAAFNPAISRADEKDRLYDFTDAYYVANGVNPDMIQGRRQAVPPAATEDIPNFPYQRDVRALLTLPAYDDSGHPHFFTVMGGGSTGLFLANAAGRNAKAVADQSFEYIFPQQGTDPNGLGAFRQSVVLDMRHGYFSNDPLGIWTHVWVSYTAQAFNTKNGQKALADLARKNGLDRDGTPLITSVSDIDSLFSKGLITKQQRLATDPLHYAICPVTREPRNGGIAPDQFLSLTLHADGTPLEPGFLLNFLSLQHTGDWAK